MEERKSYEDKYELKEKLGEGGNSVVFQAIQKSTGKKVAIKKFDKNRIKDYFMSEFFKAISDEEMKPYNDSYLKEIENMKTAEGIDKDNENTIKFIEYFDYEDEFVLVMELCEENLAKFISKRAQISEEEIYMILSQLNNTFRIISSKKIAHRDLKLENILVKYENKKKINILLNSLIMVRVKHYL
jgi:serine/threonine protein kinase